MFGARGSTIMTNRPEFSNMTSADCVRVLKRNRVGRLAYRNVHSVDIQPVSYVAAGKWLFVRSAYGSKLEAIDHHPFVAFEVDEIDGPFDWRSVVVHGTIYLLPMNGAPIEQREFKRAVAALKRAMPGAFTADDPVPERQTVYGLHIDRVDGRLGQSRPERKPVRRPAVARAAPKRLQMPDGF
jgi:nitroimidazol reductase NimA-like FMN-containing flavoprotein (pyridoxamine 5'-phosphate oxidase superfamily)